MASNEENSISSEKNEGTSGPTVRFDDTVYTDRDPPSTKPVDENTTIDLSNTSRTNREVTRRKSGILKRRENTITTADAPPIILSDEGLKAGRVSPFTNFPLFLSMTIRSIGVIFGDM
jgi:hypothetical protein